MDVIAGVATTLAVLLLLLPWRAGAVRQPPARRPAYSPGSGWLSGVAPRLGFASADRLCQHAGRPWGLTGTALLQFQWLLALLCTVVFSVVSVGFGCAAGCCAWFVPRLLLSLLAQQRRAQITQELPAFLDLWGLLVGAGEGVETALAEITRRHPEWLLSTEVRRALDRVAASGLFGESLVEEARVTGSPEFVGVAQQVQNLAAGGGVPSQELIRIAERLREQRVADLVQSAGAMAVAGIFPKLGAIFLSLMPVIGAIILTVTRQVRG